MKVALPVVDGSLARHFGHCQEFVIYEVDGEEGTIAGSESLGAPPHQPGLLPRWLHERGADVIIAGGMGRRAQGLFAQAGIEVIVGAQSSDPRRIVEDYLADALETGENLCDH